MSGYLCPYIESLDQGIVPWNIFYQAQALTTGTLPTNKFTRDAK